jgi:branched-chain amino acid transport system permease protein
MELFTNQVLAGIATGAIYACMALAVVMIFQAIDHLNFAQGEMAMFSSSGCCSSRSPRHRS